MIAKPIPNNNNKLIEKPIKINQTKKDIKTIKKTFSLNISFILIFLINIIII